MRPPILVRPLTDAERTAVTAGLRSKDTFVLRRCQILRQILLASARGERAPRIAEQVGCDDQTVLDALHAFNAHGLAALRKGSSRAYHPRPIRPSRANGASSYGHCCIAVRASLAIPPACGRWSSPPRSVVPKG
jgi:hypothetical protein